MAKLDVVQAAKDAMAAAQDSALGGCYDAAFAEGVASVPAAAPGLSQADVDAAVAAAVAPLQASMADLQAKLDAEVAKESSEEAVVVGYQNAVAAMQAAVDALKALPPVAAQPSA